MAGAIPRSLLLSFEPISRHSQEIGIHITKSIWSNGLWRTTGVIIQNDHPMFGKGKKPGVLWCFGKKNLFFWGGIERIERVNQVLKHSHVNLSKKHVEKLGHCCLPSTTRYLSRVISTSIHLETPKVTVESPPVPRVPCRHRLWPLMGRHLNPRCPASHHNTFLSLKSH